MYCGMNKLAIVFVVGLSLVFGVPFQALSEGLTQEIIQNPDPQTLTVVVGKSLVLQSPKPLKRASLANQEVADSLVLSPTQLYLNGKTIGSTNLTLWGKDGKVFAIYEVVVQPNLTRLKTQIHELFPEEKNIQIRSSQAHITLSGSASGPEIITQVVGLASTYAPEKVMNFMQVQGVQQVMLEVKVAEMAKGLLKRLGVNFLHQNSIGGNLGTVPVNPAGRNVQVGTLDNLTSIVGNQDGSLTQLLGTTSNLGLGFRAGNSIFSMILSVLKQNNLTKILAEPTLIAISGQEASFLAGGEFPIPVPQSFGVTTIKFKEFGVSLKFNPTVLSDNKILLKIAPEVSELDFANGVNSQGFTIPAILTRKVETIVELRDGQSFAIAGLIQDNIREAIAKYPFLGDIPVLGTLFRSSSFQKNETELIVIVTPRLVKPLDMKNQSLPTDAYLEPNDFEFMLMGYLEGVRRAPAQNIGGAQVLSGFKKSGHKTISASPSKPSVSLVPVAGGLEGQFGHLAP